MREDGGLALRVVVFVEMKRQSDTFKTTFGDRISELSARLQVGQGVEDKGEGDLKDDSLA